jgi:hypothetical protein
MKEKMRGFSLYLPGATFITLGLLVVFFPMLLVALFSAALILIGVTAISIAHRLRKLRQGSEWTVAWESVDPFVGDRFERVFLYRR